MQKLQQEISRVYRLHQDGHIDGAGFSRFYQPLEERRKQLEADLPRLQAEVDVCKVDTLSSEEVAKEAQNLAKLWPKLQADEKRNIVEAITQKIVVGKEEIDISLCYLPPWKDMAFGWRKGEDSNLRWKNGSEKSQFAVLTKRGRLRSFDNSLDRIERLNVLHAEFAPRPEERTSATTSAEGGAEISSEGFFYPTEIYCKR